MLNLRTYEYTNERAFEALFGEEFDSFKEAFVHNVDRLQKQLDIEEFHERDSKTCLAILKKQFETEEQSNNIQGWGKRCGFTERVVR
ncbi:hypothetical protein Tco_1198081 [Tanacetum coccineum]